MILKLNYEYEHFTTKEIKPDGWLKRQLEIQAEGLSGNLDKVWKDVRESAWIGGNCEGWERVPYWLDGFVPLAYLLDNDDLKLRAEKYVTAIIERQESDGWICPCEKNERAKYDVWAVFLICKVLVLYYECTGDERAVDATESALKNLKNHIRLQTLFNWAQSRWFEALIPIFFLYKRKPEKWLEELAVSLATQGLDYTRLFDNWQNKTAKREWTYQTHIVNLMMALKSEALFSNVSGQNSNSFAHKMFDILQQYHGSPLGFINGDECLAGKEAIHGAELCSIAEAMYSFQVLFEITGDSSWIDKLEEYAFNFLPATISDDMWSHQYLQSVNQVACCEQNEPPVFVTNTKEANCFGLEPNFGCCTANFNQGWPKFVLSVFYKNKDGIISTTPVPSILSHKIGNTDVKIEIITEYPFGNKVNYKITTSDPIEFAFEIKIPQCKYAILDGKEVKPSSITTLKRIWNNDEIVLELSREAELKACDDNLYVVKSGSLYFAAPIKEEKTIVEYVRNGVERKFPYCDYSIMPAETWGWAFSEVSSDLEFNTIDSYPFSRKNHAITVNARLATINWGTTENQPNVCRAVPLETKPISYIDKKLVPYGATNLRLTAMPKIKP